MFEFPWIFGLSGLLSYFIGISQAIGQVKATFKIYVSTEIFFILFV